MRGVIARQRLMLWDVCSRMRGEVLPPRYAKKFLMLPACAGDPMTSFTLRFTAYAPRMRGSDLLAKDMQKNFLCSMRGRIASPLMLPACAG